jgi:hypothetical protein
MARLDGVLGMGSMVGLVSVSCSFSVCIVLSAVSHRLISLISDIPLSRVVYNLLCRVVYSISCLIPILHL